MIEGSLLHHGRLIAIPDEIRARFQEGDQLFATDTGGVLHVPLDVAKQVGMCVERAKRASAALTEVADESISEFFARAASRLMNTDVRERLKHVNREDEERARTAGRSTTRLVLDDRMLEAMRESFALWSEQPVQREVLVEEVDHGTWSVSRVLAPLGVVGFVFEGRPNVVVDACGVLVTGNTCVFRIGRDARRTAEAIIHHVVEPALRESSLPRDSVVLIPQDDHASGWALFSNRHISLAVARGSGAAVQDLGAVARQSGVPVSLHGRGGAWFLVGESAAEHRLHATLMHSLDRKVCNTANVIVIPRSRATDYWSVIKRAVGDAARRRNTTGIVHLIATRSAQPIDLIAHDDEHVRVVAATIDELATEWEWENDPEVSVLVVDDFAESIESFNEYSPRLVASVISESTNDHDMAWQRLACPFIGDGFSRWVDGQFAFRRPELGLSNWEEGIPLGRGAILSGSDIHSVRYRVKQRDENLHR